MDRKSRSEPSPSESLWFCNLQLLGFQDSGSPVPLTQTMFDHSNPGGFHQVFYFLFNQLNSGKTKTELRDCWPILDKKQEAEFRRKVVNMLKEYQKEFPLDLPFTNPSLFQSPGGRKFVAFLEVFSNLVMKMYINKFDDTLLSKPVTKNSTLRKVCYTALVKKEKQSLDMALKAQTGIKDIEKDSRESMNKITEKYFELKKTGNNVENDKAVTELEKSHPEYVNSGRIDKQSILDHYDMKCEKVKEMQEKLRALSADHEDSWDNIMSVVDDSLPQIKLNFNQLPAELVAEDNLSVTYENMITKVLATTGKVLDFEHQVLPIKEVALGSSNIESQVHLLTDMQAEVGITVKQMQEQVHGMLNISTRIDWANSELATSLPPSLRLAECSQVLLPPTPSILDTMTGPTGKTPGMMSHLQLLSPATPHPASHHQEPSDSSLGSTPVSTSQVSRRITHRVTPDPSPLLRQSLMQSRQVKTNNKEGEYYNQSHDSKDSLGVFSPVLCSTKTQNSSSCSQANYSAMDSPEGRNGKSMNATQSMNSTQSKIEMYKQILLSVKGKDKQQDTSKSNLLAAWNHHRQSVSPGSRLFNLDKESQSNSKSPPKQFSPLLRYQTPDKSQQEMDSKLATRLDQLMTSLTFSDNSLDFSLGRMEMEGEMELLSPHCP